MAEEGESSDDEDRGGGARGAVSGDPVGIVPGTKLIRSNSGNSVPYTQGVSSREGFRSLLVDLLGYGGAGGQVSVVVTSRESVGGGWWGSRRRYSPWTRCPPWTPRGSSRSAPRGTS